jgi:hypothetical protein
MTKFFVQGKNSSQLNLLPFMDNYHHNFMLEDIFFQTGARESYRDNHLRSAWLASSLVNHLRSAWLVSATVN